MDDESKMLRDSLIICALFWAAMLFLATLSGCTQHKVDVSSSSVDRIVDRIAPVQQCPTLAMAPIPQDVVLDIKGDTITANAGGELLVRYYSQARQLLAPGTRKP